MGRKKLTTKDIKERIYSLEGDNYELLSEYVGSLTKFKIKHNTCGCIFEVNWNNFQQGSRCPKCAREKLGEKLSLNNETVIRAIYELVGDEYTKLDNVYVNAHTKFKIKHNTCGHEYEVNWNNFQQGSRCPKCGGTMKLTNEDIVQKIYDLVGDEYTKLDDTYINAQTKFKIRHVACGCEYMVSWSNFQQGKRCPKCNQSKGEKFIEDYLTNKGISFAAQVRFDDCRHKLPLPFDFAIMDDSRRIICLVEYDGEQHFEPIEIWGGEENLKEVQLRDQIKDSYCKKNNIPLLRIRYDDEDIEERLNLFIAQEQRKRVAN